MYTKETTTKKIFDLGKISYSDTNSRRIYPVEVAVELKHIHSTEDDGTSLPGLYIFSVTGSIGNREFGQCLNAINEYRHQLKEEETFSIIYDLWKKHHLNNMHAGCPAQEEAVKEWLASGNQNDFEAVCEMLKAKGLYVVNHTGYINRNGYINREWVENEPYEYGSGWVYKEIPEEDLATIKSLLRD